MNHRTDDNRAALSDQNHPETIQSNDVDMTPEQIWQCVQSNLHSEYGDTTFDRWLKILEFNGLKARKVTLLAPTGFIRDWIISHYIRRMEDIWRTYDSSLDLIEISVGKGAPSLMPQQTRDREANLKTDQIDRPMHTGSPTMMQRRFTFDNFVVGKSNELAYHAALRVTETSTVEFNPLYLYGSVGLGKTHLMYAIAEQIQRITPERKVVYLTAEKFMLEFINALRNKDIMAFKEMFRSVDILLIDDVQFISGKDSTQEEFFHTFNALIEQNCQIVLSGDRSPSDLTGMEERLRSRLGWGLVVDIHTTDYELRLGILKNMVEARAVHIPEQILQFLANRISNNMRELEGALNTVIAQSRLSDTPLTLEPVKEILQSLLRANDRKITIEDVKRRVADYYNIKQSEMDSSRRTRTVVRPRQIAMYLSKNLTTRSLPEIGRKFGNRDHTTVIHAVRKIEELCQTDASLTEDIDLLRRKLSD